ncbi:N-acetyltransferase [Enterococcus sp. LJL99]
MLANYRKEQRKIAMGLLSFHQKLTEYQLVLKEIDMYEQEETLHLFLWTPQGEKNIQGIVGIEVQSEDAITLHDISIIPSFRGEAVGFILLDELTELYSEAKIYGTLATSPYLSKWKEYKN